jgi:hypothetical protein
MVNESSAQFNEAGRFRPAFSIQIDGLSGHVYAEIASQARLVLALEALVASVLMAAIFFIIRLDIVVHIIREVHWGASFDTF